MVTHSLGNVTSPNYPHHYDDMLHCKWLFLAPPGHRLVFQFHRHFSTELGYDRVTVRPPDRRLLIGRSRTADSASETTNQSTAYLSRGWGGGYPNLT